MPAAPNEEQSRELGLLATTSAFFFYHERLGEQAGPFLRPIETASNPSFRPKWS
jgi:hypothetical protein